MTDLLHLISQYGLSIVMLTTMLACLMLPAPATPVLLAAGTLTGTGHLHLPEIFAAALIGAIAGDVLACLIAREIAPRLIRNSPRRAAIFARAQQLLDRRGDLALFLGRWLISPLGPALNYVAGMAGFPLPRFILASAAGEAVWAALYLGIGHLFGRNYRAAAHDIADGSIAIMVLVIGCAVALILWRKWHR